MHIIIGLLTLIVTILWLLHRLAEMGIDLGGLNPFYWRRRRAWRMKYEGDPIFAVDDPMEVAAILVVGIAKLGGDMSVEQKQTVIDEFESAFSLSEREALQLLGSSSHLLGHPQLIRTQLDRVLDKHKDLFTADQVDSIVQMMTTVGSSDGPLTDEQTSLLSDVRARLNVPRVMTGAWGRGS